MDSSPGTQKKILAAAAAEFVERGKDGARMQSVANRAGVNKALLHYYYRSKELLYRAVLEQVMFSVWGTIRTRLAESESSPTGNLQTTIHIVAEAYIDGLSRYPGFVRIMLRELADGGDGIRTIVSHFLNDYGDIPAHLMQQLSVARERGAINTIDRTHLIISMVGMVAASFAAQQAAVAAGPPLNLLVQSGPDFLKERVEQITKLACYGLFGRDVE